jgi:signal transduction histidine kinase/DNA-binding LacI/PurR family transcriptional regulator/HPt (histidine-containing phosphotransfer) domain-containing protein/ActR/RegA family two-component response regulator
MNSEKNRISFIIDSIDSVWVQNVWPPFARYARKLSKDLYIFPGGRLSHGHNSDNLRNHIYSLVNSKNMDGVILYSTCIKNKETTEDEFKKFCSGLKPLPIVSMNDKIPGYPSVVSDCYMGIKKLITHCIKNHGARRIAFLCGPDTHHDALERLRGYKDALSEAGLSSSHDNSMITDPFAWEDGEKAAAQLFEERKLRPGYDFDTIIGANDDITVDAIEYFSRRGFYMPQDYHALGFDNSLKSLFPESPLSTVMTSYKAMSIEAFRILVECIDKKGSLDSVQIEDVILPAKPVIRNSCGCGSTHYHLLEPEPDVSFCEPDEATMITKINEYLELDEKEIKVFITPVIRAWSGISQQNNLSLISRSSEAVFFHCFEKAVVRFFGINRDSGLLLRLLQDLYNSGLISASQFMKYEPVIMKIIFKVWGQLSIHAQYRRKNQDTALSSLRFELLETRDRISLVKSLAKHLPKIGIEVAGVALYIDNKTSLWVGSYSPDGINPIKEQLFTADLLVPEPLKDLFSHGVFLIQPLFIEDRALGYFIHTVSSTNGSIYEELCSTISYALKGIFQFEEIMRAQQKVMESIEQNRILTLQKEATQAASEAKTQFLASVSHEIRTPMNAVLGMAELLLSENLNNRQRHYAEDIRTSAMSLLSIVNKILDLSKMQSGKMDLSPVHYDFISMVDNIGSMTRSLIKGKNVAFDMEMHGEIPKYLYGDNARLRQILLNILSNAVKFTEKGHVRLLISVSDEEIRFTVMDTGMGIKKEDLIDLFDAFKQADTVVNRDYKGTGLGLTITKALVEMMDGEIEVESVLEQGTTVHVTIPKVIGDETKVQRYIATKKLLCSPDTNILAVDDNAINLNVICGLLRQCGVTVSAAASGKEAIEMLSMNQYNLVFMDHMMPGMDGIETTKKIREMGIKTPVIALTANAIKSAKEMLLASGMDDFISKPIVKEQLYEMLARWIPESKYIDPQVEEAVNLSNIFLDDRKFWDKIGEIDGISCNIGLERVSGQAEIYKDTLKLFVKETQKYITVLAELLTAKDTHAFTIQAHSIKSSLANVGAMNLSSKAYELESAGARNDIDFCTSHLQSFSSELDDLGNKLSEAFSELPKGSGTAVISTELELILTKMKDYLNGKKYVEINDSLKKLETQKLDGPLKDKIEEIMDAIIIMDYQSALDEIQKLLG